MKDKRKQEADRLYESLSEHSKKVFDRNPERFSHLMNGAYTPTFIDNATWIAEDIINSFRRALKKPPVDFGIPSLDKK